MIDSLIYDWFMIDPPGGGGGNRTRDLVVESRRVQDHWAIPVIPSKWYPKYSLYPAFSEFTQHLQNLPNMFRIYPTFSECSQHFQNLPNIFSFSQHLQNFPNTFRIHPPPSEKICVEASGPFCTFFGICVDPKNVGLGKHDFIGRTFWTNRKTMSLCLI